jgi:RNA-directed DNA polymerase
MEPKGPKAESLERRDPTKGNAAARAQGPGRSAGNTPVTALERIREAAEKDKEEQFTALWHHVYDVDRLRRAFQAIRRDGAPGVDGQTWKSYGENLEANLEDLSKRLARGAYRASPVRRVYISKTDGGQRPIGVPVLEDKLVQRATVEVLNAVYEADFLGFSYGFRPGRNQHGALDAVSVGIEHRNVNWVFDADIRGFFDSIDHGWLLQFVEHRIADPRILRHIRKWLHAGVLEDGTVTRSERGTPQGGSISPLLANIYLHYAFDLWAQQWRRRHARGDMIIVRYADDIILGFQHRDDAERFRQDLAARLAKFALTLHETKTRLFEFGRYAAKNRRERGESKPETFDFLGFTHYCGTSRKGRFCLKRKSASKKIRAKLREISVELRRRLHASVAETGRWLNAVLRGHYQYYGVPDNWKALNAFRYRVLRMWLWSLNRRSQRSGVTGDRMAKYVARWFPPMRCYHPWPSQRLVVRT